MANRDSDAVQQEEVVEYMLTTQDNPFNPFEQWDEWFSYDETMGYHTCALLARVTYTSDELSETDQDLAVQLAVHEVATENVSGMHLMVSRETFTIKK